MEVWGAAALWRGDRADVVPRMGVPMDMLWSECRCECEAVVGRVSEARKFGFASACQYFLGQRRVDLYKSLYDSIEGSNSDMNI